MMMETTEFLEICEPAYLALLMMPIQCKARHTGVTTDALIGLRDAIAKAKNISSERVQTEMENAANTWKFNNNAI